MAHLLGRDETLRARSSERRQLAHELDGARFDLGGVVVESGDVEAALQPDPLDRARPPARRAGRPTPWARRGRSGSTRAAPGTGARRVRLRGSSTPSNIESIGSIGVALVGRSRATPWHGDVGADRGQSTRAPASIMPRSMSLKLCGRRVHERVDDDEAGDLRVALARARWRASRPSTDRLRRRDRSGRRAPRRPSSAAADQSAQPVGIMSSTLVPCPGRSGSSTVKPAAAKRLRERAHRLRAAR